MKNVHRWLKVILCSAMLVLLASCASVPPTTYTPGPAEVSGLTALEAKKKLTELLERSVKGGLCQHYEFGDHPTRTGIQVTFSDVRVTCNDGNSYVHRFADSPSPSVTYTPPNMSSIYGISSVNLRVTSASRDGFFGAVKAYWRDNPEAGKEFVRAWYVLANTGGSNVSDDAAFTETVRAYRAANPKPQMREEAVKFKVQAEFAVQQKRFDDATVLFGKALQLVPWWGAGYFNRSLILAELGVYGEAIADMKRYLALEPDAPEARAAQLKIYQWESVAPAR